MKKERQVDSDTFETVRARYEDWDESREKKPYRGPPAAYRSKGSGLSRTLTSALGFGIGLALLALALYSFWVGAAWSDIARGGAAVGYTVVGFFLLIAGLGCLISTWNHNYRVLTRPAAHH